MRKPKPKGYWPAWLDVEVPKVQPHYSHYWPINQTPEIQYEPWPDLKFEGTPFPGDPRQEQKLWIVKDVGCPCAGAPYENHWTVTANGVNYPNCVACQAECCQWWNKPRRDHIKELHADLLQLLEQKRREADEALGPRWTELKERYAA